MAEDPLVFLSTEYIFHQMKQHFILLTLIGILSVMYYRYFTKEFNKFKEMGVKFIKPHLIFNELIPMFISSSVHECTMTLYKKFPGLPYAGYFEGPIPVLMIRDPELVKAITIKDFDHFAERKVWDMNSQRCLKRMLVHLQGKEWKTLRAILTPTFSSAKMRGMEGLVRQCGKQMIEFLNNRPKGEIEVEMKAFTARYTLEVIGSCAFGLDCASLKDPNAEFVKIAAKYHEVPFYERFVFFLTFAYIPAFLRYIPFDMSNRKSISYLREVVIKTKAEREKDPEKKRNDFMQLLMEAAEKELKENDGKPVILDEVTLQGQAIFFILAGLDSSGTLLSFASALLAKHPEIQERLRNEIKKAEEKMGTESLMDLVNSVPLLEYVVLETLRMYPPVARIDRICTKPYTLPGTNVKIEVGDMLSVPLCGIQMDPNIYPHPDTFDPDRYVAEEKNLRSNEHYLPFGLGPKNCIGIRFAMMSAKFYLYHLISNFKLSTSNKTEDTILYDKGSVFLKPANGIWINIESLDPK